MHVHIGVCVAALDLMNIDKFFGPPESYVILESW